MRETTAVYLLDEDKILDKYVSFSEFTRENGLAYATLLEHLHRPKARPSSKTARWLIDNGYLVRTRLAEARAKIEARKAEFAEFAAQNPRITA
jgi:hypothetical protein